jgi:hypothetical protein
VLDAAKAGDTLLLQAGATFVGNFVLGPKSGAGYVTIRSSTKDSELPAANQRISPAYAPKLAKLQSPNAQPALSTSPGAKRYRVQLLEFLANAGGDGDIIALGDGTDGQATIDSVPSDLVLDRVYIHGDATKGQLRGIALNSGSTTISNSYVSDIKAPNSDSQAIAAWRMPKSWPAARRGASPTTAARASEARRAVRLGMRLRA